MVTHLCLINGYYMYECHTELTTSSLENLHQSRQKDVGTVPVSGLVRSYVAAPPACLACHATNGNLVRDGTV